MFDSLRYNLKHNRKNVTKNVAAVFIFGAIILVFVAWGLTPRNTGVAQGGAAAVVNGSTISLAQLNEASERLSRDPRMERLQALGGEMSRKIIQSQALSQLIELELLKQATEREHIVTSDAEVADTIFKIPAFQENGRFKSELYKGYLDAVRKPAGEFEDEIRNQDSLQRVYRLFGAALDSIPLEVDKQKALEKMKANLEFVSFSTDNLVDPTAVSQADAKSFLAKADNQPRVKDYFTNHKSEFSTPEEAKVRHILIKADPGDPESDKKALAKADDVYNKAQKGDFAKLAAEYSDDPGSKSQGGVIDYFPRGRMVPEFEKVAFSAPVKEISKPVKSQFGYHIIQVLDRKAANDRKFEDVQTEIAQKLIAQDRSAAQLAAIDDELKRGDSAAIQKFVTDRKLKWADTGVFTVESENVPKIGPNDEVVRSAFLLTPEHPYHQALVRQGPTAYVLRYKAVPASTEKAEDNDMMKEMAASQRTDDAVRQWVDVLKKDAKIATNAQAGSAPASDD